MCHFFNDKLIHNNFEIRAYTLDEAKMQNKYKVNNIFNNEGISFNDLVTKLVASFIDKDLNLFVSNDIITFNMDQNINIID